MKTFLGKIEAKVDAKGRVFVPSVFRKVFSEEDRERIVVRMEADEKYLVVYPESVWNKQVLDLQSKLNEWDPEDQMLLMQFVGDAEMLEFDAQGRVLLPKRLQTRLCGDSELIFVGMVDRIALWSKSMYEEQFAVKAKLSERLKMLGRKD
jgi:MraZ protein